MLLEALATKVSPPPIRRVHPDYHPIVTQPSPQPELPKAPDIIKEKVEDIVIHTIPGTVISPEPRKKR